MSVSAHCATRDATSVCHSGSIMDFIYSICMPVYKSLLGLVWTSLSSVFSRHTYPNNFLSPWKPIPLLFLLRFP